jgi:hypothetical protein
MKTRDILRSALRIAGVIAQNEDATTEDMSIAQETLRLLLDTWSINPQLVWLRDVIEFSCVPTTSNITLPYRPVRVLGCTYEIGTQNAVIYQLGEIDELTFNQTPIRHTGLPRNFFYDHDLTINLVGASTGVLKVIVQPQLSDVSADLETELALPPGYESAIKYNTGLLLCEEFGKEPSAVLIDLASGALQAVKSQNKRPAITRTQVGQAFGPRGRMPIPRANMPQT